MSVHHCGCQESVRSNVGVLIPAYNAASTIASTLQALQANSDLINIECVIVLDDASTDGTAEVAKSAWRSAVPLEVRRNPSNLGQWPTTNLALRGLPRKIEWALILHADDVVKPNWLSLYLEAMQSCQANVATICSSYDCWDSETGRIEPGEEAPDRPVDLVPGTKESVLDTLDRGCWWHISGCAIRVNAFHEIGDFKPSIPYSGDWEWLLRCLGSGHSVLYLPRSTMLYRQHTKAVSSQSFRRALDIEEQLRVYAMYKGYGYLSTARYLRYLGRAVRNICRRTSVRMWRRDIMGAACHAKLLPRVLGQLSNQTIRLGSLPYRRERRQFQWVSSIDPAMALHLSHLSAAMTEFYGNPATRNVYQQMIDADSSSQPQTEQALCEAVLLAEPTNVLEIGCGSGRIYQRLKLLGLKAKYTGVEVSSEVIGSNAQRFPEANWICGDGYQPNVGQQSQDCIFAYYVLEHCVYPRRCLEAALVALKPGGSLFLVFPDMIKSRLVPSQGLGWDDRSAQSHLREGRLLHFLVRLFDSRVRLPLALRGVSRRTGDFLVNLRPRCLTQPSDFQPDVDAIYLASGHEVKEWALSSGCSLHFYPLAEQFRNNVFVQIVKPIGDPTAPT